MCSSSSSFRRVLITIATKKISATICHQLLRDRSKAISITSIVGASLALLSFILRLWARMIASQFGLDDWNMIAAMVIIVTRSHFIVAHVI